MAEPNDHCPACGRNFAADRPRWRCDCGGPLDLAPGAGAVAPRYRNWERVPMALAAGLGMRRAPLVSLGEGWTPLVERDWDGAKVHFKLEIADAERVV